jgi:hypothetical protein
MIERGVEGRGGGWLGRRLGEAVELLVAGHGGCSHEWGELELMLDWVML